jgi:molybdate/tungstate transport system substrate-binding protein
VISVVALALSGCGPDAQRTLEVYHAGSLSVPFGEVEEVFERRHPDVDVRRHAHGSATAIRQVTELGRKADVVGSADYRLIDRLMIESDPAWASWNLLFARNAMGIAMGEGSPELNMENWAESVSRADTRVGISNPNQDPCGYRSLMVLALAQQLGAGAVYDRVVADHSNIALEAVDDRCHVRAPSVIDVRDPLVMRPKETDLVALLQSGAIDYLFIYRSVASQHGLSFFELPDEFSLSLVEQSDTYAKVSVTLSADMPADAVELTGAPIVYGVTIPTTVQEPALAEEFVRLLTSPEGRGILSGCGQQPITPARLSEFSHGDATFLQE